MRESFIIGKIIIASRAFVSCFRASVIYKLIMAVSNLFKHSFDKSLYKRVFFQKNLLETSEKSSFIHAIFAWKIRIFEKISIRTRGVNIAFTNSYFGGIIATIANNGTRMPLRCYGIILMIMSLGIFVFSTIYTSFKIGFIIGGVVLALGLLMFVFKHSLSTLFEGSIFNKLWSNIFDYDIVKKQQSDITFEGKNSIIIGVICALMFALGDPLAVLALIVGICGFILLVANPFYCVFFVALASPFLPTMMLVAFILISFVAFIINAIFIGKAKFYFDGLGIWVLLFAAVYAISSIFSFARGESIKVMLVSVVFMSLYLLVVSAVKNRDEFKKLLHGFLFAALIVSLIGIYQNFFASDAIGGWIDKDMFSDITGRVISTFGNPNVLGEYLLLVIPVGLIMVFTQKNKLSKLYYAFVTLALTLCIVFTYSRGCWLALIVSIAVLLMLTEKRLIWLGVLALVIGFFILPSSIINRFASIGNMADSSTSFRVYIWLATISLLKVFWPSGIGTGIGAYDTVYPIFAYPGVPAPHSHNLYLQIATESGVAGMLVFGGLVISYLRKGFTLAKNAVLKADRLLCAAFVSAMIGFLFQGLFDYVWYNYRVVLIFWLSLSLISLVGKFNNNSREGNGHE